MTKNYNFLMKVSDETGNLSMEQVEAQVEKILDVGSDLTQNKTTIFITETSITERVDEQSLEQAVHSLCEDESTEADFLLLLEQLQERGFTIEKKEKGEKKSGWVKTKDGDRFYSTKKIDVE